MSSEELKQLKDQVKILESHLKVFQNHIYMLQNDFQYNQKNYQLEIAKQQNQITNLASLVLDIVKDNRHIEEARETQVLQKITNILNIDVTNEFASLTGGGPNPGGTSLSNDNLSSITGLAINPSTGSNQSSNGSASNANTFLNPHNRVNSNDQNLLTPSSNQLSIQQQIQQQQPQQQQQQLLPHHQRQLQPQTQQQHLQSQGQHQQQLQQQHHPLQQQSLAALQQSFQQQQQQQRQQSQVHQQHHHQQSQQQQQQQQQKRKTNKRRNTETATASTDAAALLADDPLENYAPTTTHHQQQKPTQQIRPSLTTQNPSHSNRQIPIAINPNSDNPTTESPKRRKVYDKDYAFIKAPSSVEEIWNEYSVGLNNQPSIKQLEEEYKTGWRRDPATSKKFNRRKAIYRAIEKGLDKGYSLQNCIQLLEDYRYIDREKNLKQPIGWLCHGNLPEELK